MSTMSPEQSPNPAATRYERYDDVDQRVRPMRVILYTAGQSIDINNQPLESQQQLAVRMQMENITDDVAREIRCLVTRDNYAPKAFRLPEAGITVFVEYADESIHSKSASALTGETHASSTFSGFGGASKSAWRSPS